MVVGCKFEVRRFFWSYVTFKIGNITNFKVPYSDGFSLTDPRQTLKKPWKDGIKLESLRLTDLQLMYPKYTDQHNNGELNLAL